MELAANQLVFQDSDASSSQTQEDHEGRSDLSPQVSLHETLRKSKSSMAHRSPQVQKKRYQHHMADVPTIKPNFLNKRESIGPTVKQQESLKQLDASSGIDGLKSSNRHPANRRRKFDTSNATDNHPSNVNLSRDEDLVSQNKSSVFEASEQESKATLKQRVQFSKEIPFKGSDSFAQIEPEGISQVKASVLSPLDNRYQTRFQLLRDRSCCKSWLHPVFTLYSASGTPLLQARKSWCYCNSYYSIWQNGVLAGVLRGNFGGTAFELLSVGAEGREVIAYIHYKSQCTCLGSAHRQMQIFVRADGESLVDSSVGVGGHLKLVTKEPIWNEGKQRYSLNFRGKKPIPSTKNMVLVQEQAPQAYKMMFYKMQNDRFDLEATSPLSALACMGILLTSFDFKLFVQ